MSEHIPEVSVEVHAPSEPEPPAQDVPLLSIAESLGRVEASLQGLTSRIETQERRTDESWNLLHELRTQTAASETLAEEAMETAEEAVQATEEAESAPQELEVLDLAPPEPEAESIPEPPPKRPRGNLWEHL